MAKSAPAASDDDSKPSVADILRESLAASLELQLQLGKIQKIIDDNLKGPDE